MTNYQIFTKAIKKDWYTQGFNGNPLYLNPAAFSGLTMKRELGFGYDSFLLHYQNGFGEVGYSKESLKKIWQIIKEKLAKNPNFLRQVEQKYNEKFSNYYSVFGQIDNNCLNKLSQKDLVDLFKKCGRAVTDSAGTAHILEAIGVQLEQEFKKDLLQEINQPEDFNKNYSLLATPSKLSFISQEEEELRKIPLNAANTEELLKAHAKKYFWIQNSYVGPRNLTHRFFLSQLKRLSKEAPVKANIKAQKTNLLKKLNFSPALKSKVALIDWATIWQDERKSRILKSIGYLGMCAREVAMRSRLDLDSINMLGVMDLAKIHSLDDLNMLKKEMASRKKGVFFYMENKKEYSLSGSDHIKLKKLKKKLEFLGAEQDNEIHGSIASAGTAIGRVVICRGLSSLKKVKKGDVLVASMTRPEFMPALKKAAAVITDEGGITCHAAIISRELKIPAVISAKIATKILKDGMLVEVKGNHGVVRILR